MTAPSAQSRLMLACGEEEGGEGNDNASVILPAQLDMAMTHVVVISVAAL